MFIRNRFRTLMAAAVLALAPPVAVGCIFVHDDTSPRVVTGTVTIRWSVESSFDPGACGFHRADRMEIVVRDDLGRVVTQTNPPCSAFNTTLELPAGRYAASLTLLDAASNPVSTTLDTAPFDVLGGRGEMVDTDFPADSFFF